VQGDPVRTLGGGHRGGNVALLTGCEKKQESPVGKLKKAGGEAKKQGEEAAEEAQEAGEDLQD